MQSYEAYSKEELIAEIKSLRRLHKELLQTFHETEHMEFGWTGNLGQWFWNFTTNEVTFNPMKATALGYTIEELPEKITFQFFTEKVHPEDYKEVMEKMKAHLAGEIPIWEVKYRIQAKDGSWKVYQDRGKVTERNEAGEPLFLKGIVFDITEEEQELEKLMAKNDSLKNQIKIDSLTSLYTRSVLMLELAKLVNKAKREEQIFSLIKLRIDDYEKYEENFGIVLAEELLKEAGHIVKSVVKEDHAAGRFRETVFMILLENISQEEARVVAETIRKKVADAFFTIPERVTISAGVTTYKQNDTISELIEKTGEKLVVAQNEGGNQVII